MSKAVAQYIATVLVFVLILCIKESAGQKIEFCRFEKPVIKEILACLLTTAPEGTNQKWNKIREMYKDQEAEDVFQQMCEENPSTVTAMFNAFVAQQSRADKPKFKQLITECAKKFESKAKKT